MVTGMGWSRLLAVSLLVAACSPASNPATTPYPPPSTTSTTRATTTTLATTTTVDRLTEIEAIYQDLEERRLDALYRGDEEAYRAVHVNNGYLEEALVLLGTVTFDAPPTPDVEILEVIHDGAECIAVNRLIHRADKGEDNPPAIAVLELRDELWLLSYVGTGWICDGPHPFDS
jgi:hypothetical protein